MAEYLSASAKPGTVMAKASCDRALAGESNSRNRGKSEDTCYRSRDGDTHTVPNGHGRNASGPIPRRRGFLASVWALGSFRQVSRGRRLGSGQRNGLRLAGKKSPRTVEGLGIALSVRDLSRGGAGVELSFAGVEWLVREVLKEAGDAAVLDPPDAREAVLAAAARIG